MQLGVSFCFEYGTILAALGTLFSVSLYRRECGQRVPTSRFDAVLCR